MLFPRPPPTIIRRCSPMPGKARRVAARQSQLNQRRRKQQRGPSGTPPVVAAPVQVDDSPSGEVAEQPEQTAAPARASRAPHPCGSSTCPRQSTSFRPGQGRTAGCVQLRWAGDSPHPGNGRCGSGRPGGSRSSAVGDYGSSSIGTAAPRHTGTTGCLFDERRPGKRFVCG